MINPRFFVRVGGGGEGGGGVLSMSVISFLGTTKIEEIQEEGEIYPDLAL